MKMQRGRITSETWPPFSCPLSFAFMRHQSLQAKQMSTLGSSKLVIWAFWPAERLVVPREGSVDTDALLCASHLFKSFACATAGAQSWQWAFHCGHSPTHKPLWLILALIVRPPETRQTNPTKTPRTLLSLQMNGCIHGKYFSELEQEVEKGGRESPLPVENEPASLLLLVQHFHVQQCRCSTICGGSCRVQDYMGKVKGSCYRLLTLEKYSSGRKRNSIAGVVINFHGCSIETWENVYELKAAFYNVWMIVLQCSNSISDWQKTLQQRDDELTDGYSASLKHVS